MTEQSFDPQRFKNEQRRDWDVAAAGWKKWWPVFERAAQHVSDRLVELAGIKQGARVLDIATGNGEPAVSRILSARDFPMSDHMRSEACPIRGSERSGAGVSLFFRPQRVPNPLPIWPRQSNVC